jgi:hypothetical protein
LGSKEFEELWQKIKEKSQEEIVDAILSEAKQYGPIVVMLLLRLVSG